MLPSAIFGFGRSALVGLLRQAAVATVKALLSPNDACKPHKEEFTINRKNRWVGLNHALPA